jgi:hypothetical protein
MVRFNAKKLNEVEGTEKNHAEVSNRFAPLEDRVLKFQPKRVYFIMN